MTYMNERALSQYEKVGVRGAITDADPHAIIQVLMQAVLERIGRAKIALNRGNVAAKANLLPETIRIIDALRAHLDLEKGGEIAANLDALYDYMSRRLIDANSLNDVSALDEVSHLLAEIKSAWDAIAPTR